MSRGAAAGTSVRTGGSPGPIDVFSPHRGVGGHACLAPGHPPTRPLVPHPGPSQTRGLAVHAAARTVRRRAPSLRAGHHPSHGRPVGTIGSQLSSQVTRLTSASSSCSSLRNRRRIGIFEASPVCSVSSAHARKHAAPSEVFQLDAAWSSNELRGHDVAGDGRDPEEDATEQVHRRLPPTRAAAPRQPAAPGAARRRDVRDPARD